MQSPGAVRVGRLRAAWRSALARSNLDSYLPMRIEEVPVVETHVMKNAEAPGSIGETPTAIVSSDKCDLRRHRQGPAQPADRYIFAEVVVIVLTRHPVRVAACTDDGPEPGGASGKIPRNAPFERLD